MKFQDIPLQRRFYYNGRVYIKCTDEKCSLNSYDIASGDYVFIPNNAKVHVAGL